MSFGKVSNFFAGLCSRKRGYKHRTNSKEIKKAKKKGINIVFAAMTVDGFISRKDGDVEWLNNVPQDPSYDFYPHFMKDVGVLVMGSKSFDFCIKQKTWPYPNHVSYVFTNKKGKKDTELIKFVSGDVIEFMNKKIKCDKKKNVWIMGGGDLILQFLKAGLVDEIIVGIVPILLGNGIPLFFNRMGNDIKLEVYNSESYNKSGIVQIHYRVLKKKLTKKN